MTPKSEEDAEFSASDKFWKREIQNQKWPYKFLREKIASSVIDAKNREKTKKKFISPVIQVESDKLNKKATKSFLKIGSF